MVLLFIVFKTLLMGVRTRTRDTPTPAVSSRLTSGLEPLALLISPFGKENERTRK